VPKEEITIYNLTLGENTYASQTSQEPSTARRVLSLIPSRNGQLTRENGEALYRTNNLSSKVGAFFQYDFNDNTGAKQTKIFAATKNSIYVDNGTIWSILTLPLTNGGTSNAPLNDYPHFAIVDNLLHVGDGTTNYLYDGPNDTWVIEGFSIPLWAGAVDTTTSGTFTSVIGRYYWFTFADETGGRAHESSSSLISPSTGAITNKTVKFSPTPGTVNVTNGSMAVVGTNTNFVASMVGMLLYVNGLDIGFIASVTDATHLTLQSVALSTITGGSILIFPPRANHIHIYASEIEGSKLGQYLGTMSINANPPVFSDQSPFVNQLNSTFLLIDRPIRNDPAPPSRILEVHKYRIFRRRETKPNFFTYSANEEVSSGNGNGSPQESVPGADVNTLSDIINETSYPKESNRIRALCSHADALYIGTEKEIIPLYGDSIDDFGLAQVTAISNGVISRWGMETTSHGLLIFTYDRKLLLFPPLSTVFAVIPEKQNITDQLTELGLPMRNKFLTISSTDQDNVRILWYNYSVRNWAVICYQDNTSTYHTYVYDFETKGWFELQRGFASLAVLEPTPGNKILVGGGTDGFVYVIDDLNGFFTPNPTFPSALFRTALIDFGHPDVLHVPDYVEYEVTNQAFAQNSVTVNFYLDPQDADNPGTPHTVPMFPVPNRPNLYRGFFSAADGGMGVLCKRLMVELNIASDTNAGAIRAFSLKADPVPNLFQ
jgi:hypothetical protein